jgi:hypothetical protein
MQDNMLFRQAALQMERISFCLMAPGSRIQAADDHQQHGMALSHHVACKP